ncbi:MAG: S46 family peptidase, partial [Tannerellaceae bacterium]
MKYFKSLWLAGAMALAAQGAYADEGMYLLNELNKKNLEQMKALGFTLPYDSLYSTTSPSVSDAVVIFGGGCTGIAVSDQGLIFTNHHCGYGAIQSKSSVEHDY